MKHYLKIAPCYFEDIASGKKCFELRKNDRDYKVGDTLVLQEWLPDIEYTGREIEKNVPYILYGGIFGLAKEDCIMSLENSIKCTYNGACPHRVHNDIYKGE
jgi:hypothetical protein